MLEKETTILYKDIEYVSHRRGRRVGSSEVWVTDRALFLSEFRGGSWGGGAGGGGGGGRGGGGGGARYSNTRRRQQAFDLVSVVYLMYHVLCPLKHIISLPLLEFEVFGTTGLETFS
ncbi:hypothetical protein Ocin01_11724 [Orchesella cincta]|uniref:Uncharacterized protein n=1 Tax=Orchesella cincta TaxID=48709 RepID=A0A1D2MPJ3_ORCCI|nr:hypothetical protein Ocin01_11724 [Orchesella cincta]